MTKEFKRKRTTFARDYIGWQVYVLIKIAICILPLRLAYWLAVVVGECFYRLAKRNRKMVENNLRTAFNLDQPTINRYTRRIFWNFCKNTVDFLRLHKFDKRWFKQRVEVVGKENMEQALNLGRGVIIVSGHLGNPELGALAGLMSGFTINAIWASHKNPKIEKLFVEPRLKKGIKVILTGGALEKSLQALAANEAVVFVIDHSYSGRGVEVEFFGSAAIVPKGAGIAALHSKAAIVPAVCVRRPNFCYKFIFGKMIEYNITGEEEKDTQQILAKCIKPIEQFIRDYPDQWVLFHNCYQAKKSGE